MRRPGRWYNAAVSDASGDAPPGRPEEAAPGELLLRETGDRRLAYDLALVLGAESVRHRLEHAGDGPDEGAANEAPAAAAGAGQRTWRLWVPLEDAGRGEALLSAWTAENQAKALPEPAGWDGPKPGLLFAVLCVAGQLATGARDERVGWFSRGSADAARIAGGEWWRCFTALTLHADLGHALGNAVCGWFLLDAVARRVGPAWAAWLALAAGVAGNALTGEVAARTGHLSIGASTAVFGVLGSLTALQLLSRRRRGWITVGAGVALLGMLGTGERSDLYAHLFGFCAGFALGLVAGKLQPRAPTQGAAQPITAAFALVPLVIAWAFALRSSPMP